MTAMHYAMLYGSVREARVGIRAARYLKRAVEDRGRTAILIDPVEHPLPMLDKMFKEYAPGEAPAAMSAISETLDAADGVIVVSGEYNHSVPPALKNMLDHFQSEFLFKPAAICTYSAGPFGGVRCGVHLRAILGELGAATISSMLPIPKVAENFDEEGVTSNPLIEKGAGRFLDEFDWWAEAARRQRDVAAPPF